MLNTILILLSLVFPGKSGFEDELAKFFAAKFTAYDSYEYGILQMPSNYTGIKIDDSREYKITKNIAYVPVITVDRKKVEVKTYVTCRVQLFKKVLKSLEKISRFDQLSAGMFAYEKCDVTGLRGNPVSDLNEIGSYRSRMIIYKNTFLVEDLIERIPDVQSGEKMTLHTGNFGVDISLSVVTRQDGNIGEVIRVMSDDRKLYQGKIIDKFNLALIE